MALAPRFRAKDKALVFSAAYALTVTTQVYSTEIDLGVADFAVGSPVEAVIYVSAISATAASTLGIGVFSGTATAPTTAVYPVETVTGSAAFERIIKMPTHLGRYVRLGYLLTGTAASSATISAHLTARPVA